MTDLKPQLFRCLKGYSKDRFLKDLTAGVIVALLPCRSPLLWLWPLVYLRNKASIQLLWLDS